MANGSYFDEVLGLDMLSSDIQTAIMQVLTTTPKIPQTDSGVSLITAAVATACDAALKRQFLAPGTWTGATVFNLKPSTELPSGYSIQADSVANQSQTNRENRIAPPIYVCIKLAGSLQSVVINVNVNR